MARWSVWGYDVWGNARDGYEVNDRSRIGSVEGPADPTDKQAIKMAKDGGLLNHKATVRNVELDGDEGWITFSQKRDGYPLGELVRE